MLIMWARTTKPAVRRGLCILLAYASWTLSCPAWAQDAPRAPALGQPLSSAQGPTFLPALSPSAAGLPAVTPPAPAFQIPSPGPAAGGSAEPNSGDPSSSGPMYGPVDSALVKPVQPFAPCTTFEDRDPNGIATRFGWW